MLLICVDGREAPARVCNEDRMTEEDLVLGGDVVENRRDGRETDVEWVQRMFHDRPQVELHKKLEVFVATSQLAAPECDNVKDCLARGVEHDVSFRVPITIEVACSNVTVRPLAEKLQVGPESLVRQELRPR